MIDGDKIVIGENPQSLPPPGKPCHTEGNSLFRPLEQRELDLESDYLNETGHNLRLLAQLQFCRNTLIVNNLGNQTVNKD